MKRTFKTIKNLSERVLFDITLLDIITKRCRVKSIITPIDFTITEPIDYKAIAATIRYKGDIESVIKILHDNPIFISKYLHYFSRIIYNGVGWEYQVGQSYPSETLAIRKLFKRLEDRDV